MQEEVVLRSDYVIVFVNMLVKVCQSHAPISFSSVFITGNIGNVILDDPVIIEHSKNWAEIVRKRYHILSIK